MPKYTVRIRFHGVVGYVESCDQKQVALFLPKAGRRLVPNQVAYVRFPVSAYVEGRTLAGRDPDAPWKLGHVVLKRERLRFDGSGPRPLEINKKSDPFGSKTPTSATEKSLFFVPDLDDLSGNKGTIEPGYLRKNPRKARPRLIARVDVDGGRLETTGVDPVQIPFDSDPGGSANARRQPIAREFLLTLTVTTNKWVLKTEPFKKGASGQGDLHFKIPDNGLDIVIGNESEADIYKEVLPIEPVDTLARACMAEFKFYYRMCATEPETALMPYLSSRPGSETCCSGARFRPEESLDLPENDAKDGKTSEGREKKTPEDDEHHKWTMLAYLAADNSLSGIAAADVDKLEEGDGVGVVAQVDQTGRPTERLKLEDEGFVVFDKTWKNLNSGDWRVLGKFLRKGKKVRPADHYAVFLLTHGAGLLDFTFPHPRPKPGCSPLRLLGVFWLWLLSFPLRLFSRVKFLDLVPLDMAPDMTSGDYLDNQELVRGLRYALRNKEKFAIIGFDACVMALAEMAFELREVGRFLVASQDDVNVDGYPYHKILRRIGDKEPEQAVRTIVEAYGCSTKKKKKQYATLSGIRLWEMTGVVTALNALGALLLEHLEKHGVADLAYARNGAYRFSTFHYIDLVDYTEALIRIFGAGSDIGQAATAVASAVSRAVVCTNDDGCECEPSRAHGLSIYLPDTRLERVEKLYDALAIAKDPNDKKKKKPSQWRNFVFAYSKAR